MKLKAIILSAAIALSGCAVMKPQVTSFDCKDCKAEVQQMLSYTGKFAGYRITRATSEGFSGSVSSQENFNFRSGMVTNAYVNVWIEGKRINVEAMNNASTDYDMITALNNARTYKWTDETVHKTQSVVVDERREMVAPLFINF